MAQCPFRRSSHKSQRDHLWGLCDGHLRLRMTSHTSFSDSNLPGARIHHGPCPAYHTYEYPSLLRPATNKTGGVFSNTHAVVSPLAILTQISSSLQTPHLMLLYRRYDLCCGKHSPDVTHCTKQEHGLRGNLCQPTNILQLQISTGADNTFWAEGNTATGFACVAPR